MEKIKYIIFNAGVNTQSGEKLKNAIVECLNNGYDELYFLISSGGGSVNVGLDIASLIKSLSIKTTMHNIGAVDSVANVIFSAGQTRLSNQNSSFLFHGIQMNFKEAHFTSEQLNEQYQIALRLEEDIAKNVASNIGADIKVIEDLMGRPKKIVSIEEAKKLGIIHDVKNAEIPKGSEVISVGDI